MSDYFEVLDEDLSRFFLPVGKMDEAFNAAKAALDKHYVGGCTSLEEVLRAMGWRPIVDAEGNIVALKNGARRQVVVFSVIAPFVREGSKLYVVDTEYHRRWRLVFTGGKMVVERGHTSYRRCSQKNGLFFYP